MSATVNKEFETVTVREDGSMTARPLWRLRPKVPIEVRLNNNADGGVHLRAVERRTELRNAEYIRHAGPQLGLLLPETRKRPRSTGTLGADGQLEVTS